MQTPEQGKSYVSKVKLKLHIILNKITIISPLFYYFSTFHVLEQIELQPNLTNYIY